MELQEVNRFTEVVEGATGRPVIGSSRGGNQQEPDRVGTMSKRAPHPSRSGHTTILIPDPDAVPMRRGSDPTLRRRPDPRVDSKHTFRIGIGRTRGTARPVTHADATTEG